LIPWLLNSGSRGQGQNGVDVITHAGERLISELSTADIEERSVARDTQPVEDVHRTDPDTEVRGHRPAGGDVLEHIGQDRMGVSVPADPIRVVTGPVFGHVVPAIAVFCFEAPRPS
jgi:hypothetical protein